MLHLACLDKCMQMLWGLFDQPRKRVMMSNKSLSSWIRTYRSHLSTDRQIDWSATAVVLKMHTASTFWHHWQENSFLNLPLSVLSEGEWSKIDQISDKEE